MTVFEFAICRYAMRFMPPDLLREAKALAARADNGDQEARRQLRELSLELISTYGGKSPVERPPKGQPE